MPPRPSSDPPTPISAHPSGMSCTTVLSLKTVPSGSERVRRRLPRTPPLGRKKAERGEAARRHGTGGRKGAHHSEGRAAEVRASFGSAKRIRGNRMRFKICGNKYRMVVAFDYAKGAAYIRWVGTHDEYDRINAEKV